LSKKKLNFQLSKYKFLKIYTFIPL